MDLDKIATRIATNSDDPILDLKGPFKADTHDWTNSGGIEILDAELIINNPDFFKVDTKKLKAMEKASAWYAKQYENDPNWTIDKLIGVREPYDIVVEFDVTSSKINSLDDFNWSVINIAGVDLTEEDAKRTHDLLQKEIPETLLDKAKEYISEPEEDFNEPDPDWGYTTDRDYPPYGYSPD